MPRKNLIERFPNIWRDLDSSGFTERFLGVADFQLNTARDKIEAFLSSKNINSIQDRFLILLKDLVGHDWITDRNRQWNRDRIRHSIRRHNYKGSVARLQDVTREAGADRIAVQDNASILMILGKQGRLSCSDAYLVADNFYHDGAKKLSIWDSEAPKIDQAFLSSELAATLPAGEVWFIESILELDTSIELSWEQSGAQLFPSTNALLGTLGFGILGNEIFLSFEPQNGTQLSFTEVDRIQLTNEADPAPDESGIQSTGYYEIFAVTGATLTGESGLPSDILSDISADIDNIVTFFNRGTGGVTAKASKINFLTLQTITGGIMGVTSYKKRSKLALLDKTNSVFWLAIGRTTPWTDENAPPAAAPGDAGMDEPICYVKPQTISLCKLVDTGEDIIHKGNKYKFVLDADAITEDARFLYMFARFDPSQGQPYANFRQVAVYDGLTPVAGHENDLWLAPGNVDNPGQWEYLDNDVVTTMTSSRIQVIELVVEIR